ncbi:Nuclear pore complex protein NUP85 [Rhynchospora pubera]|uniref:Nuclear pore complex protein Nup85 n=1 Tax=Rhynchospora pubera TaxID=906938 RepID=A0AAV8G124_9POAL|nr:Nuclear pore complex protein NUP85 [Rhynchospora pubera]
MPGIPSDSSSLIPFALEGSSQPPPVYPLQHGLRAPIHRIHISWSRGNLLNVTCLRPPPDQEEEMAREEDGIGGKAIEVLLGGAILEGNIGEHKRRRIAYESVKSYAFLHDKKISLAKMETGDNLSAPALTYWWQYTLEYSKSIRDILGNARLHRPLIEDPKNFLKPEEVEQPIGTKAAWELMEIFYVDMQLLSWLPERLVDWLEGYDSLLSKTETVHSKLAILQRKVTSMRIVEDEPGYWNGLAAALAVGWLDVVAKLLRLHGSYDPDQFDKRETENGLVEAVVLLVSEMPRMRPNLPNGKLGICYQTKHDYIKGLEKWRVKVSGLESSPFWVHCNHRPTRDGLINLLHILLGDAKHIADATSHWLELFISHLLYIRPLTNVNFCSFFCGFPILHISLQAIVYAFKPLNRQTITVHTVYFPYCSRQTLYKDDRAFIMIMLLWRLMIKGLEGMGNLAEKCMNLKPSANNGLTSLLAGILSENPEIVLADCLKAFGPWIVAHAVDLLTANSEYTDGLLNEERYQLGGASIGELYMLVYAQALASHPLTWQVAPAYLSTCSNQGRGLLEILLLRQPVQNYRVVLKTLEICHLYELGNISTHIMKMAGMYQWKHGHKGLGIYWFQQSRDKTRLSQIAHKLFDNIGKSLSDDSFKQWEGLMELLGSDVGIAGGLEFLHKYREFKRSLQQIVNGGTVEAAKKSTELLVQLMRNPSTPQRFWLPLLLDSVKLLEWRSGPLLGVSETNLLLGKLQELSMAKLRPDFHGGELKPNALGDVRLALAKNLGRAILEGP